MDTFTQIRAMYSVSPCGDLADSNGVLTQAGNKTVRCITNWLAAAIPALNEDADDGINQYVT